MLGKNYKRPQNTSSASGTRYKTNHDRLIGMYMSGSEGKKEKLTAQDDPITHRLGRIFAYNELVSKNVGFYFNPEVDVTLPGIHSYPLRAEITTYLERKKANPNDPNLLVDLNLIPVDAEFLYNLDVEVTPDGQHGSKRAYVERMATEARARAQSIHYLETRETHWYHRKWDATNNGGNNGRAARIALVETDRLAEVHNPMFIQIPNHVSIFSVKLVSNPQLVFDVAEKVAEDAAIMERMVKSLSLEEKIRRDAASEFDKLSAVIAGNITQYDTDAAKIMEVLNKYYDQPIIESIRPLLNAREFRAAAKTLRERFEAADDQETVEAYTNIMNNLRYNPYKMEFVQFMNIFSLVLDILKSVNIQGVSDGSVLYYLKQSMSNCSGEYVKLKTAFDDLKFNNPDGVPLDMYIVGLRSAYTTVLNNKRKHDNLAGEEYQRSRVKGNNNYSDYNTNSVDYEYSEEGDFSDYDDDNGENLNAVSATDNVECYRCHNYGHYANQCPTRENASVTERDSDYSSVKCYRCEDYGHYAYECPTRFEDRGESYEGRTVRVDSSSARGSRMY